jgi:mono/diheme cytochrome c family protein
MRIAAPRIRAAASAFLVVGLAALLAAPLVFAQDEPKGDAARGKQLYLSVGCYECHGRAGQGGAFNGPAPALAQTALPLIAFRAQLREPYGDMPPYAASVMPDSGVADIFAYVRSLPGARSPKDIAILKR